MKKYEQSSSSSSSSSPIVFVDVRVNCAIRLQNIDCLQFMISSERERISKGICIEMCSNNNRMEWGARDLCAFIFCATLRRYIVSLADTQLVGCHRHICRLFDRCDRWEEHWNCFSRQFVSIENNSQRLC